MCSESRILEGELGCLFSWHQGPWGCACWGRNLGSKRLIFCFVVAAAVSPSRSLSVGFCFVSESMYIYIVHPAFYHGATHIRSMCTNSHATLPQESGDKTEVPHSPSVLCKQPHVQCTPVERGVWEHEHLAWEC